MIGCVLYTHTHRNNWPKLFLKEMWLAFSLVITQNQAHACCKPGAESSCSESGQNTVWLCIFCPLVVSNRCRENCTTARFAQAEPFFDMLPYSMAIDGLRIHNYTNHSIHFHELFFSFSISWKSFSLNNIPF